MKLKIDKSQLNRENKADCRIKSFVVALASEGIYYTPSEILLDATALDFNFIDLNSKGTSVYTLLGVSTDLYENFAKNTKINIEHYSNQSNEEDLELITNAISNGHCVMAMTDRYGLFRLLNPRIFRNISPNKHMTQHMIVIYGVDLKKKKYLVCEASSSLSKYHSVWIDIDKLNAVRKCEFLGVGINKDIYIIEETKDYKKPNQSEMVLLQIEKLRNNLTKSISKLLEFVLFFKQSCKKDNNLKRYLVLQSQVLAITIAGFDKSKYFYRGDFLKIFETVYTDSKKEEFILQISDIKSKWANIAEKLINLSKGLNYENVIEVGELIIIVAENELSFCESFISEYKKWGGDKGGRIKKCPDYRSGIR